MERGVYEKYYDQGFKAKKLSDNDGHVPFVPWHRPHRVLGYSVAEMMAAPWWCHQCVRKNHRLKVENEELTRVTCALSKFCNASSPSGHLGLSDLSPCLLSSPYQLKLEGSNDLGAFITQVIKKSVDVYGAQFKLNQTRIWI